MSVSWRDRIPRWLPPAAGLLLLHLLVSWPFPWEGGSLLGALARPNPDLVLVLSLAFALALRGGVRWYASHGAALVLLFVPLYRFGATVMPVFYGKELDPYNDVLMAPGLVHLLLHRHPAWLQVVLSLVTIVVVLLLYMLFHRVVRAVVRTGRHCPWCLGFLGAAQALVLAGWIHGAASTTDARGPWAAAMLPPACADGVGAVQRWREVAGYQDVLAAAEQRHAELAGDLSGLQGADVYVLFVESYGMALFRKPEAAETFRGWAPGWRKALQADGFDVLSAMCHPSISGGASSLAHAQFMAGVTVENRRHFDALLQSSLAPLPRRFTEAGYRALNVQPATNAEWPEGKFFGFEADLFSSFFPYEGHSYHWGYMPDQFALATLVEKEVRPATRPLFVQYISVTSHAPFSMIPPVLEDWEAAARPDAFAGDPERVYPINWLNYATHPQVEEAYMDSVRYSLETMVSFARQLTRPSLLIILGDHQAPRVGNLRNFDGTFDVAVHVIANREHLLAPFHATGFREGFVPDESFPSHSTTEFLSYFLTLFGG